MRSRNRSTTSTSTRTSSARWSCPKATKSARRLGRRCRTSGFPGRRPQSGKERFQDPVSIPGPWWVGRRRSFSLCGLVLAGHHSSYRFEESIEAIVEYLVEHLLILWIELDREDARDERLELAGIEPRSVGVTEIDVDGAAAQAVHDEHGPAVGTAPRPARFGLSLFAVRPRHSRELRRDRTTRFEELRRIEAREPHAAA